MSAEPLLTALSMENNHNHHNNHHHNHPRHNHNQNLLQLPSTFLSMDPAGLSQQEEFDREVRNLLLQPLGSGGRGNNPRPPDINLPLSVEPTPPPPSWGSDACDMLDVGLAVPHGYDSDTVPAPPAAAVAAAAVGHPKVCNSNGGGAGARKCAKRNDSIWGAWFFFSYYFKPVMSEKSKNRVCANGNGVGAASVASLEKSDLRLDVFLVQHDMENMYMWVFKERPENALGKMQLRSFMNGHSRQGEPQFPFSAEKGFVRSHRMQRKHYRGLSNPQCLHGIEVVQSPNLAGVPEADRKKWLELTGRDVNFSIPPEASDFESWRNLPSTDFELERPATTTVKSNSHSHHKKLLNGSTLNLSTQPSNHTNGDALEIPAICSKRRKDFSPNAMEEDCSNSYSDKGTQEMEINANALEAIWANDFSGVMRNASGPVTAAKTIYEDDDGYLIMVSLPFSDLHKVKVSWRNTLTHGIVKISCVSIGRLPFVKRHDRTFKLTDPAPEHCPPGEFVREISLATRIPEDATLEAYYDETGTGLEIVVPKHRVGPEEHEVHVCMRPPSSWSQ